MLAFPHPSPGSSGEQGTTLIELLVAILASIVVVGALMAILELSLGQQARITDRAQADQIGRSAMSKIVEQLHSACTGTTPIQAPSSTPTSPLESANRVNLWFISAYGNSDSGEAELGTVTEHDIHWGETGESDTHLKLGTLTDYAFTGTGTQTKWTFPSFTTANAKATVIAKNVVPPLVGSSPTIFQYYKYETNSSSSNYGKLVAMPSSEALTVETAKTVAKVAISFTQAPEPEAGKAADTRLDRTASLSDSVVLRLDPTSSGSESPCE
jgi:Tfp pilus assembly protein PilW